MASAVVSPLSHKIVSVYLRKSNIGKGGEASWKLLWEKQNLKTIESLLKW